MALAIAAEAEDIARSLLDPLFATEQGIRLFGITLSSFEEDRQTEANQLSLMI